MALGLSLALALLLVLCSNGCSSTEAQCTAVANLPPLVDPDRESMPREVQAIILDYSFECSGRAVSWGVLTRGGGGFENTIDFQVWRPVGGENSQEYQLVGSERYPGFRQEDRELIKYPIDIEVESGDVVGLYLDNMDGWRVQLHSIPATVGFHYTKVGSPPSSLTYGDLIKTVGAPIITVSIEPSPKPVKSSSLSKAVESSASSEPPIETSSSSSLLRHPLVLTNTPTSGLSTALPTLHMGPNASPAPNALPEQTLTPRSLIEDRIISATPAVPMPNDSSPLGLTNIIIAACVSLAFITVAVSLCVIVLVFASYKRGKRNSILLNTTHTSHIYDTPTFINNPKLRSKSKASITSTTRLVQGTEHELGNIQTAPNRAYEVPSHTSGPGDTNIYSDPQQKVAQNVTNTVSTIPNPAYRDPSQSNTDNDVNMYTDEQGMMSNMAYEELATVNPSSSALEDTDRVYEYPEVPLKPGKKTVYDESFVYDYAVEPPLH